nr:MAG TPA: hypothetical protein [Caudoviricetes sp.]
MIFRLLCVRMPFERYSNLEHFVLRNTFLYKSKC